MGKSSGKCDRQRRADVGQALLPVDRGRLVRSTSENKGKPDTTGGGLQSNGRLYF